MIFSKTVSLKKTDVTELDIWVKISKYFVIDFKCRIKNANQLTVNAILNEIIHIEVKIFNFAYNLNALISVFFQLAKLF